METITRANYKFYLDGTLLTDEPMGWDELTDKIQRVEEVKGLFVTQDATLTFYGQGYNILKTKFNASFCDSCELRIDESCDQGISFYTIHEGIIFVSSCEFYYNTCTATAKIEDNSFYAKINNNKSIKTFLEVGKSKNGVTFPAADDYTVALFDPCTAGLVGRAPHMVRVNEAFRVLVAFMTDYTVDYHSSLFDVGGEGEGDCITDGLHLRSTNSTDFSIATYIQKVSFMDIFKEMDKKYNLGIMIDNSGTRPKIIIERDSFFKNNTSILTLNNIPDLKTTVDVNRLYSQVHFGGQTTRQVGAGCPSGLAFPVDNFFIAYKDETYYPLGTCNIDKTLDLYGQWIVDTNIIQDLVVNGNDLYDEQIFLLETTYFAPVLGEAKQGNPFGLLTATPRYYNEKFMNNNIASRYLGAIPNSIAQALNNLGDECLILRNQVDVIFVDHSASTAQLSPVVFNDKTTPPYNDAGGNFNLALGRYTATATGGLYLFELDFSFILFDCTAFAIAPRVLYIRVRFIHTDSGGVAIGTTDEIVFPYLVSSDTQYSQIVQGIPYNATAVSRMFIMNIGDRIDVKIILDYPDLLVTLSGRVNMAIGECHFRTGYTSNGGGTVAVYDPAAYPVYKFEFEYPLTRPDFQKLLDQPNYAMTINIKVPSPGVFDGNDFIASSESWNVFIEQAKYKRKTGIAAFTCFASKDQILSLPQ